MADVKQLLLQTKNTLRDDSSLESTPTFYSKFGNLLYLKSGGSECFMTISDEGSYLAELKANCEARDSDFKQRSQMREDETKAIAQAIKVMKEKAGGYTD